MKSVGLLEAIIEISHERGLDQDTVVDAVKEAIAAAAERKYKQYNNIEASFNRKTGGIELMHYRVVVDHVTDPDNEIHLDEVRKLDPLAELGDEVEYEIVSSEFTKKIAQTARQLIFQKIREVERDMIVNKFAAKKGEIVHGTVGRIERNRIIVLLQNNVEAILDRREQIPFEKFQSGEHIRVYLLDIFPDAKGPQISVSRTHPGFLIKLFEMEVPEIYDGIIEIIGAAREPGKRAKISVKTNDPDVDPVGACVGVRGARVQAVVNELCGERIDIVEYAEVLENYIANALAPAEISRMKINEQERFVDVEVEQDQLSLAIGKQGQNVRLASQLCGHKINVSALSNEIESTDRPQFNETKNKADEEVSTTVVDKDKQEQTKVNEEVSTTVDVKTMEIGKDKQEQAS